MRLLLLLAFFHGCLLSRAATANPATKKTTATVAKGRTQRPKNAQQQQQQVSDDVVSLAASVLNEEREAPLIDDINLLSAILGDIVGTENPHIHALYSDFRKYGLRRSNSPNEPKKSMEALSCMIKDASNLSPKEAVGVMRMFSVMLNLVNSAEVHHRKRVLKGLLHNQIEALPDLQDSVQGTIQALLNEDHSPKEIFDQICSQKVEIVLTAHPTQVQRKSLLRKYKRISEVLNELELSTTEYEKQQCIVELKRIISAIWGADEIRRNKPTPQQEAAGGNAVIESVLWEAVPSYLRKLQQTCESQLQRKLPVDVVPIKFGSWIGGDRDGEYTFRNFSLYLFFRVSCVSLFTKPSSMFLF